MIQYALKCDNDHRFDSWFQSAAAFEKLQTARMVMCPVCNSSSVNKVLMAPAVRPARSVAASAPSEPSPAPAVSATSPPGPLSAPASPSEQMIAELKQKVESTSDYVGESFATEARAMHEGDAPERSIYGEAKLDEAKKLIEDGVPILPLPFRPSGKDN